jgi:hypothetical protein
VSALETSLIWIVLVFAMAGPFRSAEHAIPLAHGQGWIIA